MCLALGVIRLIKMFGYESKVREQVGEKRDKELSLTMKKYYWNIINSVYK